MSRLHIVQGDITTFEGDAIVNAANPALAPGSGVCGAIFKAAGPYLEEEIRKFYGRSGCHTGDAVVTTAHNLPVKRIIHAVGPIWRGGSHCEGVLLTSAYLRSMEVAWGEGCLSVAFPAISTGVYGFPHEIAAHIAVGTVRMGLTHYPTMEVTLYVFDEPMLRYYENALAALT